LLASEPKDQGDHVSEEISEVGKSLARFLIANGGKRKLSPRKARAAA
jgi:hypothetical protein